MCEGTALPLRAWTPVLHLPVSLETDLTALERIRQPGLGATNARVQRS
jgi:hypothetical protein